MHGGNESKFRLEHVSLLLHTPVYAVPPEATPSGRSILLAAKHNQDPEGVTAQSPGNVYRVV